MKTVPFAPVEMPRYTAKQLLREIQRRKGRVFRLRQVAVFCLTTDPELAEWLLSLGGTRFVPRGAEDVLTEDGGYWRDGRTKQVREWDVYIHAIPVKGDETIHEAAGHNKRVEQIEEVA